MSTLDGEGSRDREAGYSLVFLVIIFTVLSIMVAAALPMWSHAIQREKEEELISRGLQYAEAIRIFQQKNGRPPIRLEELLEVKPRCIRRLWKDPMTDDGKWGLVFINQNGPMTPQTPGTDDPTGRQGPPGPPGGFKPAPKGDSGGEGETGTVENDPHALPKKGDEVAVGPLMGVHSKSHKKSILIFNGRERYDEWMFTTELVNQVRVEFQGVGIPLTAPGTPPANLTSLRWIGRPVPAFADPLQNGSGPNGPNGPNGPGGLGGPGGRTKGPTNTKPGSGFRAAPRDGSQPGG